RRRESAAAEASCLSPCRMPRAGQGQPASSLSQPTHSTRFARHLSSRSENTSRDRLFVHVTSVPLLSSETPVTAQLIPAWSSTWPPFFVTWVLVPPGSHLILFSGQSFHTPSDAGLSPGGLTSSVTRNGVLTGVLTNSNVIFVFGPTLAFEITCILKLS